MVKQAAVLIPIIQDDVLTSVLYLKRTDTVKTHKNQICFPGGLYQDDDKELKNTAIRETFEETGIRISHNQIIHEMQPLKTLSGFNVTAFAALIPPQNNIILDTREIEEYFTVPINFLNKPGNLQAHGKDILRDPMYFINYREYNIWGVTAKLTKYLLDLGVLSYAKQN